MLWQTKYFKSYKNKQTYTIIKQTTSTITEPYTLWKKNIQSRNEE